MAELKRRPLGRSGVEIAPLVLGGNVFGWTADRQTSFRLLDAWLIGRPAVTAPIVSATSLEQLRDIAGAARLDLSADAVAKLDAVSRRGDLA